MTYEDLAQCQIFSDDEQTLAYIHDSVGDIQNLKLLRKAKKMKKQLQDFKQFKLDGMKSILATITDMNKA